MSNGTSCDCLPTPLGLSAPVPQPLPMPVPPRPTDRLGLDQTRVLLIDDEEDDFAFIEGILGAVSGAAYDLVRVTTAADGVTALGNPDDRFDVCLIDYRLGSSTAVDVLDAVAASDPEYRTPCIVLTTDDDPMTDHRAMAAGAVDFLVKGSVTPADLERSIRYAIVNERSAQSVRALEQRFRLVFEASQEGIVVFDRCGMIVGANPAALETFGIHDPVGMSFKDIIAHNEIEPISDQFRRWAEIGPVALRQVETVGRRHDGTTFPLEVSISSFVQGGERHWGAVLRDASRTRAMLDQLTHETLHDRLTGVGNRTLLRDRVSQALLLAALTEGDSAVLIVDIDDFKRVNDVYGHAVGDRMLREVASRISTELRSGETVARIGNDEFGILVDGRDSRSVVRLAERLRSALATPFDFGCGPTSITVSIGVAMLGSDPETTADEEIRKADVAMYGAKTNGKNRVEVFEQDTYGTLLDLIALDRDLRAAIANGDITADYQPIVDLDTGEIVSVEALARWKHPDRGWVPPTEFIRTAERNGSIDQLGRVVLELAVEQLARLAPLGITMAVNVSSQQLRDDGFVDLVTGLLQRHRVDGRWLVLEVTESVLLTDADAAIRRLNALRDLGVRIALDDFGTGYSSLSYLRKLPIDELKLDRSFIKNADCPRARALIEAVAHIAISFGIPCTAEGIETEHEREVLAGLGFARAQGWLFGAAMPAAELADHLSDADLVASTT